MRLICAFVISLLSFSSFALMPEKAIRLAQCAQAALPAQANFCGSFKAVAACHCLATGTHPIICNNMTALYTAMLARYRTVQRACENQKETTTQVCLDSWSCYRSGGKDSAGQLCSTSGSAC